MKSRMAILIQELQQEQNRLLDIGKEYQLACKDRGKRSDKQMQELFEKWVNSLDDLFLGATNILRWQSQAQEVKQYCEQSKKLIEEALKREELNGK